MLQNILFQLLALISNIVTQPWSKRVYTVCTVFETPGKWPVACGFPHCFIDLASCEQWGNPPDAEADRRWEAEIDALLAGLPPETLVSVYDCHI